MTLSVSLVWVLGGLLASGLAAFVLKRGGYGVVTDIGLGLGGSLVGSVILRALGLSPDVVSFAVVAVAFAGAASLIVVQRTMWPTIT